MAKRNDNRDPATDAKIDAAAASPALTSELTPTSAAKNEDAATEPAKPEIKLPDAPQVAERVSPPPFLREHKDRVVAARPAPQVGAAAAAPAKAGAKDKPKSRFPLLAATLALA